MKASDLTVQERAEVFHRVGCKHPFVIVSLREVTRLILTGEPCREECPNCRMLLDLIVKSHCRRQGHTTPSTN